MEKRRFYRSGFIALVCLGLIEPMEAQDSKGVEVEVQVPVENANEAKALDRAKAEAFEKAYATTLPPSLDDESRKRSLRQAANFVKTFKVLSQDRVGNELKVKYWVELVPGTGSKGASGADRFTDSQFFELVWRSPIQPISSAELTHFLKKSMDADVRSIKFQYGTWVVALRSSRPQREVLNQMQSFLGSKAEVRVSGTSPYPSQAPEPSTTDGYESDFMYNE